MAATVIGRSMTLRGEIEGEDDLLLADTVIGPVTIAGRLSLDRRGTIRGAVRARASEIAGEIEGPIRCEERIELKPESRVAGDLTAPRILIADGARFEGRVQMERLKDDEGLEEDR